jgi:hypothetical protein
MSKIKISFTWVGPPPKELKGHDTAGPEQFILHFNTTEFSNATHAMFFFCLQQFEAYYQDYFKNKPIAVMSIETYVTKISLLSDEEDNQRANELRYLMRLLLSNKRNSIRDRVSIKNQFHYFLCYYQGGFVFDSNIKPAKQFKTLLNYSHFVAPRVPWTNASELETTLDVFALYSPQRDLLAKQVCDRHMTGLLKIEFTYTEKKSRAYYSAVAVNIMEALKDPWLKRSRRFWSTEVLNGKTVKIRELGVIKEQENTHKFYLRATYERSAVLESTLLSSSLFKTTSLVNFDSVQSKIFSYLSVDDLENLVIHAMGHKLPYDGYHDAFFQIQFGANDLVQAYIDNGLDIEMQVTNQQMEQLTLLHWAVQCDNVGACEMILATPKGKNLINVTTRYLCDNDWCSNSPLVLAHKLKNLTLVDLFNKALLENFDEQQVSKSIGVI